MKDKNWFIFKGDHHLGPFTFNEILNKVKLAELRDEELLWREGDSDWKPVVSQEDIVGALAAEKEKDKRERQKLEDQTRNSQRLEFADKILKERKLEEQRDQLLSEDKQKESILQKQKQREEIFAQEIARKEKLASSQGSKETPFDRDIIINGNSDGPPPLPPLPSSVAPKVKQRTGDDLEALIELSRDSQVAIDPLKSGEPTGSLRPPIDEKEKEKDEEDFLPAVPVSASTQEGLEEAYSEKEIDSHEEEHDQEDEDLEDFDQGDFESEKPQMRGRNFYGSIALVGIVLASLFLSYGFLFETKRSLAGLSRKDKENLRNLAAQDFTGVALHRLRPTANLDSLWLASNFPDEAAVYLRLVSKRGMLLGSDDQVVIQANSVFKGQAALFKELEIIEGESLLPGEYQYEIKGFQTGLMRKLTSSLGTLPFFKELKVFQPERSQFSFKGSILIASTSLSKFSALLEKKKNIVEKTILRPVRDRRQRLKTFMSFLDQVEEIYNNILGRITRGKSMYLFEKRYNKEVGPYLRDLILDTNKVHLSIINLAPKESKAYEEIMNFGKDVGFIASEMVTKTRKIRRLGRAKTEVIKEKFRLIVKELRDKGKVQLREMNGIINKYERKEKIPENKSE